MALLKIVDKFVDIQKQSRSLQAASAVRWLSCQGSNLDSSDPESDVLPITPQDNLDCKVNEYLKNKNPCTVLFPIISVTNFENNPGECRRSTSLYSICRKNLIRQTAVAGRCSAAR
jgi:hypothetical protein